MRVSRRSHGRLLTGMGLGCGRCPFALPASRYRGSQESPSSPHCPWVRWSRGEARRSPAAPCGPGEAPCRARATCCRNTLRASSFPQSGDPTSGEGPVALGSNRTPRRAIPSNAADTRWSRGDLVLVWSLKSRAGRPAVVASPGAAPDHLATLFTTRF